MAEAELIDVSHEAWQAFAPAEVAVLLAGIEVPWYVAGGWALDLFRGEVTRPHGDIEIGIPRARFAEVRARLSGFELFLAGSGRLARLGEAEPPDEFHQVWVLDPATGMFRLDVFLEPSDGDTWISRRDPRLRLPYRDLIGLRDGVPFGAPEVVLLFKAKATRDKDEVDFRSIAPILAPSQRAWLRDALDLVHPTHPWLARLRADDHHTPERHGEARRT